MPPLSMGEISSAYERFSSQDEKSINRLLRQFQKKQLPLMVYLSAVSQREEWTDEEQEIFFGMALFLWTVLSKTPRTVKMERIERADNEMLAELECRLEDDEHKLEEAAQDILKESSHPNLLAFLVDLLADEGRDSGLHPDTQGLMLLVLRNVMDLLTQ